MMKNLRKRRLSCIRKYWLWNSKKAVGQLGSWAVGQFGSLAVWQFGNLDLIIIL
jgi:hypothetical protein